MHNYSLELSAIGSVIGLSTRENAFIDGIYNSKVIVHQICASAGAGSRADVAVVGYGSDRFSSGGGRRVPLLSGFSLLQGDQGRHDLHASVSLLYSTEERGTYSRLTVIPFYSRELDPARNYLRRSWLWPLGISELKGDATYSQILPFYSPSPNTP